MMKISHLTVSLGAFGMKDLSMSIPSGSYTVIIGSSGAGKTILLETIAGLVPISEGSISINGKEITALHPRDRQIGMVYQDLMLFPHLDVFENIAFGLRLRHDSDESVTDLVTRYVEMMGISHLIRQFPVSLSGGEQQRVALARALVLDPMLLLLDEPFSALDLITRQHLREELHRIHASTKKTIIQITHHFEDIWSLADHVVLMKDGDIIQTGTPGEVFRRPASSFAATFTGVENIITGIAYEVNEKTLIDCGEITVVTTSRCQGEVIITIRPEDILVSLSPMGGEGYNMFRGLITRIESAGSQFRIEISAGLTFVALMTSQSFSMIGLEEGAVVFIAFRASDVNAFTEKE